MNIPKKCAWLTASLLLFPAAASAQEPPAAPAPAAVSPAPKADEPVKLNPFEVQADSDRGYAALNSNSITRFNTELDKLPVSADIFDQTFMNDVAATTVESMIETYSAGAGFSTPVGASGTASANQPGDRTGNAYIQLRGQNTPVMQRDGFMPVGAFGNPGSTGVNTTTNFDIERVEVINGPQALLYGGGGAGGVINVVSKQARFGQSPSGSAEFQVDQYGSKLAQFDYGMGTSNFAIRFAAIDQSLSSRRVNIGGALNGQYLQVAFKPFQNTTIRILSEQTTFNRILAASPTLTAPISDTRNGDTIHFLLATNQAGAVNPATGASYASGAIDNGLLNWSNVDSYLGWQEQEPVVNEYSSLTAETEWTSWLTTQFAIGYDPYRDDRLNPGLSFYAPGASGNNLAGWAAGVTPSDSWQPARTKGIRFSALFTNELFHETAKSQSILGWDYVRTDMGQIGYSWVQADSNWNPIVVPSVAFTGYSNLAKQEWSIDHGLVQYPLFYPNAKRATVGGVNYVRVLTNPVNPAAIAPGNPTGAVLSSGNYILTKILNGGLYGINYTQWLGGKLDTMMGFRAANSDEWRTQQPSSHVLWNTPTKKISFSLGADYEVAPWLHPYVTMSDSYDPPFLENAADPYNNPPTTSQGLGEEAGIKISNSGGTLSGSLSYYHVVAKNTPYSISSSITSDIDPGGLNGGGGSTYIDENVTSEGVQATLTAAPNRNWRIRLSGNIISGTIGKSVSYAQVYNDQFHTNASGDVTYADGTVVYVNPAFNSAAPVATAATAGAVPLTVTSLSTLSSVYYANPTPVNGAINSSSAAATVLKVVDPVHGPILTGATFLPISNYQLNTSLTGIVPPGTIVAAQAGQDTVGYPEFSTNLTAVYTFPSGWIQGFRLGGSAIANWNFRDYYYYANAPTAATAVTVQPLLFRLPTQTQLNLILGYSRKFRRITWSTQVNVTNLLNHYDIIVLPNSTTGFTTTASLNATFTQQPRSFTWTNTISF